MADPVFFKKMGYTRVCGRMLQVHVPQGVLVRVRFGALKALIQ